MFEQAKVHFEEVLSKLQLARPAMEAVIRTDMDQIITSKEHLASKIRGGWAGSRCVYTVLQGQASFSAVLSITGGGSAEDSESNPRLSCKFFSKLLFFYLFVF